jgi:hypothetical protein
MRCGSIAIQHQPDVFGGIDFSIRAAAYVFPTLDWYTF